MKLSPTLGHFARKYQRQVTRNGADYFIEKTEQLTRVVLMLVLKMTCRL